jgi:hypothetical protein
MSGKSYLTVERKDAEQWKTIATDASLSTLFEWNRWTDGLPHGSVKITWFSSLEDIPGTYKICNFGYAKPYFVFGDPRLYSGCTRAFNLV